MIAACAALIQFYPRALVALSHQIRALGDKVRLPLSPNRVPPQWKAPLLRVLLLIGRSAGIVVVKPVFQKA